MSITEQDVSDADLATLAGVSARRIRQLAESGRLVRTGRNRYNLVESFRALLDELSGGDKAAELTAERVRKLKAEATLAELELAKACKEVAPLGEIEAAWLRYTALVQTNMLRVPQRAVLQLLSEPDEARFKAVLRDEIVAALRQAETDILEPEEPTDDEENAENE